MSVIDVPRPAWMGEDLVMLEEQAERFMASKLAPQIDKWHDAGLMDRSAWTQLGAAGFLCAGIPEEYGGAGGSFAHETVINLNAACLAPMRIAGKKTFQAALMEFSTNTASVCLSMITPQLRLGGDTSRRK